MRLRVLFAASVLAVSSLGGAEASERVISLGGAVTEIIYRLGAEDQLVAVDSTSTRPAAAAELPDVGYMRALSAEGLVAMRPEVIIASEKSGPPEALEAVKSAGVEIYEVPADPSLGGVREKIRAISERLGKQEAARELLAEFDGEVEKLKAATSGVEPVRAVYLMSRGDGVLLAAGKGTAADAMLSLSGAENVMDYEGYKPVSAEALLALGPEVVVTGDRTAEAMGGTGALAEHPAVAHTPAAKGGRIFVMDDLVLLGFGPETPRAALELARLLHP